MKLSLNGRKADCTVIRGNSRDIVDAFVEQGIWIDTEDCLTDEECQAIQDANIDLVEEYALAELGCYH